MKRCVVCLADKPIGAFNELASSKDGHDGQCRDCSAGINRLERQGVANPALEYRKSLPPLTCEECGETKPRTAFVGKRASTRRVCVPCRPVRRETKEEPSMSDSEHRCPRCGITKPTDEFPATGGPKRFYLCLECRAREQAAIRAGIRVGQCATCGTPIEGRGVCGRCREAMKILGDSPEALRRAGLALKWLQE